MLPDKDTVSQSEPVGQPDARRRSRIYYGWLLLAAAAIISVAGTSAHGSFSVFAFPMAVVFGWSRSAFGIAMVIGQLMNGVTQPVIGYLFDRFDSRKVILICVTASGLAAGGLYWIYHYWHLIFLFSFVLSIMMGGASLAILWPLTARWFVKRLGLALGSLTAVQSIGSTFLTQLPVYCISQYGWRVGWLALGVVPLFLALPVGLKFLRNWPSDIGLKPDGDRETPMEAERRGSAPAVQRGRFEVDRWWRAFRSPPIWALLPGLAVGGFTSSVVSHQLVPFAIDRGYSLTTASTIHAVVVMLGAVGAVGAGGLTDRFARKKVLGVIYIVQGIAFLALAVGSQPLASFWVFAVVGGFCWAAWMPIAFAVVVDVYGLRALGAFWGIAFLCQLIGGVVSPVLNALVHELTRSYALSFGDDAALLIVVAIPVFAINEKKYSGRYEAAVKGEAAGN